jgi:chromosome segregation ATPase
VLSPSAALVNRSEWWETSHPHIPHDQHPQTASLATHLSTLDARHRSEVLTLKKTISLLEARCETSETRSSQCERELRRTKSLLSSLEKELLLCKKVAERCSHEAEKARSEAQTARKRAGKMEAVVRNTPGVGKERVLEAKVEGAQGERDRARDALRAAEQRVQQLVAQVEVLESAVELREREIGLQGGRESVLKRIAELMREKSAIGVELAHATAEAERVRRSSEEVRGLAAQLHEEKAREGQAREAAEKRLAHLEQVLAALRLEGDVLLRRIDEEVAERRRWEAKVRDRDALLAERESGMAAAQNALADLERSVRDKELALRELGASLAEERQAHDLTSQALIRERRHVIEARAGHEREEARAAGLAATQTALQAQLAGLHTQRDQLRAELEDARAETHRTKELNEALSRSRDQVAHILRGEVKVSSHQLDDLAAERDSLGRALEQTEARLEACLTRQAALEAENAALKEELEHTREAKVALQRTMLAQVSAIRAQVAEGARVNRALEARIAELEAPPTTGRKATSFKDFEAGEAASPGPSPAPPPPHHPGQQHQKQTTASAATSSTKGSAKKGPKKKLTLEAIAAGEEEI